MEERKKGVWKRGVKEAVETEETGMESGETTANCWEPGYCEPKSEITGFIGLDKPGSIGLLGEDLRGLIEKQGHTKWKL